MNYLKAGKITHYFDKIQVAVLVTTDLILKVGDKIRIGEEGGVEQVIDSMQVEHLSVNETKLNDEVGLKVVSKVKSGDLVYKIEE
jgi:hypothetical protein